MISRTIRPLAAAFVTIWVGALASAQAGFRPLGNLGSFPSLAMGVNADGSVVTGFSVAQGWMQGFRWTLETG